MLFNYFAQAYDSKFNLHSGMRNVNILMKRHSFGWNMKRVSMVPNTIEMTDSRENNRGLSEI